MANSSAAASSFPGLSRSATALSFFLFANMSRSEGSSRSQSPTLSFPDWPEFPDAPPAPLAGVTLGVSADCLPVSADCLPEPVLSGVTLPELRAVLLLLLLRDLELALSGDLFCLGLDSPCAVRDLDGSWGGVDRSLAPVPDFNPVALPTPKLLLLSFVTSMLW